MKERPILFSAPMVRAILAGTKTQTRRVVRERLGNRGKPVGDHVLWFERGQQDSTRWCGHDGLGSLGWVRCPYGEPGDRLWCKEAIRKMEPPDMQHEDGTPIVYSQYVADNAWTVADAWPWKHGVLPGMFMPRGLSRITLEVTGVRVERLHAITEADAKAEGVTVPYTDWTHRDAFAALWREINGAESWDANPWVWCLTFRRCDNAVA